MLRHITLFAIITILLAFDGWGQPNYYSKGNDDVTNRLNWFSNTDGTGSNPPNFTTNNQIFNVQNGHSMTASTTWTVSGTGSKVIIKSGGKITSGGFNHSLTLDMESNGTWIHSHTTFSALVFGTQNSNSNFQMNVNSGFSNSRTYPNLVFNFSGTFNQQTVKTNGNIVIKSGATWRGGSATTSTHTIGGSVVIESGGVFELSSAAAAPTFDIAGGINNAGTIQSPGLGIPSINITGSNATFTNSGTITATNSNWSINASKSLTLNNDLPIESGRTLTVAGTLDCGSKLVSGSGTFTLSSGGTLKIGSSAGITSSGATGNIQTTTRNFNPGGNYVYNGTTQSFGNGLPVTLTGNLTIESTSSITNSSLTINSPGTMTVNGILDLGTTTIGGTGAFTLGSGGTLKIGSTTGLNGNITVSGTKTFNSNATYDYNGVAGQITGTLLPSSITGTLKINNSSGVSLSQSTTATTVDMSLGNLDLGSNNLTLTNLNITSPSSTKMIIADDGELRKVYTTDGAFTFPIGDKTSGNDYSPVSIDLIADSYSSAYVSAKVVDAKHPNNTSATSYLTRYWTLNQSGITNPLYDINMFYVDSDINGTESDIYAGKRTAGIWYLLDASTPATNKLSGTTISGFSDFTGGEQGALPVELTSFTASAKGTSVTLNWETKTEVDNNGFEVERNSNGNWNKIGFVEGHGTANSPKYYSFVDNGVVGNKIQYRLRQVDNDGSFEYSPVVEVELNPTEFALYQNYPNPFNPSTMIRFSIPVGGTVALNVFNTLGEKVAALLNGQLEAGYHEVSFDAANLPSGLYFYEIKTGDFSSIKKMILMK